MSLVASKPTSPQAEYKRIIGAHRGQTPGPSVVVVAGLHGNEPSGIIALQRVFRRLDGFRPPFRGEFVGLAGNLRALARRARFLEYDLNRCWTPERVAELRRKPHDDAGPPEDAEVRELLDTLDDVFARARGEICFLDLHTSSAAGEPFVLLGDTLRNRRFAMQFPAPIILGLEEQIDGVLLEYVNARGHVTLGFEAGQHDVPTSINHQAAAIWTALLAAGNIAARDMPEAATARDSLADSLDHLPPILEILYRHGIHPSDRFQMKPGYQNFQPIQRGEHLADNAGGEIRAPLPGRILLPLYQGLGDDGFFIGREVKPFWLKLSAVLRHLRVDRIAHWLPGVRRHPTQPHTLIINQRVAHWLALEAFHLLGFRKKRLVGDQLTVSRRMYDIKGPTRNEN